MNECKSKEWLEEHYVRRGMTQTEIAAIAGVSPASIRLWLKKAGFIAPNKPRRSSFHHTYKSVPPRRKIVFANAAFLSTLEWFSDPFDLDNQDDIHEALTTCWACGLYDESDRDRAHVLSKKHGGSNHPTNFFLLCSSCHDAQPDGQTREIQVEWLRDAGERDRRAEIQEARHSLDWRQLTTELKPILGDHANAYVLSGRFIDAYFRGGDASASWEKETHWANRRAAIIADAKDFVAALPASA